MSEILLYEACKYISSGMFFNASKVVKLLFDNVKSSSVGRSCIPSIEVKVLWSRYKEWRLFKLERSGTVVILLLDKLTNLSSSKSFSCSILFTWLFERSSLRRSVQYWRPSRETILLLGTSNISKDAISSLVRV